MFFFSDFSLTDFAKKHALTLHNLSQSLTIRAPSPLQYSEWIEAIKLTMQKGKVIIDKSRSEVSLMEQDKIENVSSPIKDNFFSNFL